MEEKSADTHQELLNRLDALFQHGHLNITFPEQTSQPAPDAAPMRVDRALPETPVNRPEVVDSVPVLVTDSIPTLTEVYQEEAVGAASPSDNLETVATELLLQLQQSMERALAEELEKTKAALLSRLQMEATTLLQQHLADKNRV